MSQDRYEAQDQERRTTANELGDGFTRVANALAHVDRRRTNLAGGHEGDDMDPLQRMRFAFQGQPRAARYDGDSDSAPKAERCKCGHTDKRHNDDDECRSCTCVEFRLDASPLCCCGHGESQHRPASLVNARTFAQGSMPSVCHRPLCKCLHYEPDGVRGLNSDPTAAAGIKPDKAAGDLKAHDKDMEAALVILRRIEDRLEEYNQARPASDADRAQLEKANIRPEPGCTNCGKYGHWQPVDPRVPKRAVCGWCLSWERDTGDLPGKRECDLHADDKNVRRPDKNHISRRKSA